MSLDDPSEAVVLLKNLRSPKPKIIRSSERPALLELLSGLFTLAFPVCFRPSFERSYIVDGILVDVAPWLFAASDAGIVGYAK